MSITKAFTVQAEACEALGSGFTASLCKVLGSRLSRDTAVGRLCLDWDSDDPGPSGDSIPLRLCGGLHALVVSGRSAALMEHYPPYAETAPSWNILETALVEHEDFLLDWMQSPPQTNEVARAGVVWPAMMRIAQETQLPLRLLEVGASAGLNLQMDRFSYRHGGEASGEAGSALELAPEMRGQDVETVPTQVRRRAGCDINPLDPANDEHVLRLRSYIWPDQRDRRARFDAAISIARAHPVTVEKMDAVAWLERELAGPVAGLCTVVYSTIAWQYLPEAARAEGEAVIDDAGGRASDDAPLAWLRFEADGQSPGAALTVRTWPGNSETVPLGRGDFHGRWLDWRGAQTSVR